MRKEIRFKTANFFFFGKKKKRLFKCSSKNLHVYESRQVWGVKEIVSKRKQGKPLKIEKIHLLQKIKARQKKQDFEISFAGAYD